MNQATLPFPEKHKLTLREAAHAWMDRHPLAMSLYQKFAKQMLERNLEFGIGQLTERVRWECRIDGREEFKINNNWRAYIARQLVLEMPELAPLIECRITRAADLPMNHPKADQRVDPLTDEPIDEDES